MVLWRDQIILASGAARSKCLGEEKMNGIKNYSNELRETIGDTFQRAIKGQMAFVFFIAQKVKYIGPDDTQKS